MLIYTGDLSIFVFPIDTSGEEIRYIFDWIESDPTIRQNPGYETTQGCDG